MKKALKDLLAIVALLSVAGILATYVSKRRVIDKRNACLHNLKDLAFGVTNYNVEYGRCLCGTIQNPMLPPEQRLSWQIAIGPFIESSNPLSDVNRSEAFNSTHNQAIFDQR